MKTPIDDLLDVYHRYSILFVRYRHRNAVVWCASCHAPRFLTIDGFDRCQRCLCDQVLPEAPLVLD